MEQREKPIPCHPGEGRDRSLRRRRERGDPVSFLGVDRRSTPLGSRVRGDGDGSDAFRPCHPGAGRGTVIRPSESRGPVVRLGQCRGPVIRLGQCRGSVIRLGQCRGPVIRRPRERGDPVSFLGVDRRSTPPGSRVRGNDGDGSDAFRPCHPGAGRGPGSCRCDVIDRLPAFAERPNPSERRHFERHQLEGLRFAPHHGDEMRFRRHHGSEMRLQRHHGKEMRFQRHRSSQIRMERPVPPFRSRSA